MRTIKKKIYSHGYFVFFSQTERCELSTNQNAVFLRERKLMKRVYSKGNEYIFDRLYRHIRVSSAKYIAY